MKYTAMLFKKMEDGLYMNPSMPYASRLTKEVCENMIKATRTIPKECSKVYLDEEGNYIVEIEDKLVEQKTYQIWSEGYWCTGMENIPAPAQFIAESKGTDFVDAVKKWYYSDKNNESHYGSLDISDNGIPRLWACRLFDNEADARKRFG